MSRCDEKHSNRFIFDYVHKTIGLLGFFSGSIEAFFVIKNKYFFFISLVVVALYLGVLMPDNNLSTNTWCILTGWTD